MIPRKPVAVVFDMDGLIFDTECHWLSAMIESSTAHGYEMTPEFYRTMLGQPWEGIQERILAHYGNAFPIESVRAMCGKRFHELCDRRLDLKAGVLELLDLLDEADIPYAVATSSARDSVLANFAHHALTDRFRCVVAQGDYHRGKPNPDPYLTAARRLGVDPTDCLALEDSHTGVRAASAAGMMTIMVPDIVFPTDEIRALCVGVTRDLHEVRAAIATLLATDSADAACANDVHGLSLPLGSDPSDRSL